jgi:hypothetical protein
MTPDDGKGIAAECRSNAASLVVLFPLRLFLQMMPMASQRAHASWKITVYHRWRLQLIFLVVGARLLKNMVVIEACAIVVVAGERPRFFRISSWEVENDVKI